MEDLHVKILWGIGFFLLYALLLQPLIVRILFPLARECVRQPRMRTTVPLILLLLALLVLPLIVIDTFAIVRLFYAMMAVTNIQKVVSYIGEGGSVGPLDEQKEEYLSFMAGYTTNFADRPVPLSADEEPPDPGQLRFRALLKLAVPAIVILLNVHNRREGSPVHRRAVRSARSRACRPDQERPQTRCSNPGHAALPIRHLFWVSVEGESYHPSMAVPIRVPSPRGEVASPAEYRHLLPVKRLIVAYM